MKTYQLLGVFFSLMLVLSCNSSPDFIGSWKLQKLQLGEEIITGNDIGNPSYVFNKDKTYSIIIDDIKQTGTWNLEGSELTLVNNEDKKSESKLTIVEVKDSIFHYTTGVGDDISEVFLIKK